MPSLVSVIVPNRNYSKYLRECLTAIFTQTYQWLEVILICPTIFEHLYSGILERFQEGGCDAEGILERIQTTSN